MKLYFRFLAAVIRALRTRRRLGVADESVLRFRVWPTDLDFNLHLNNARYLSLMDIGRLDLVAGLGVLRPMFRLRWSPVVGAAMLRFRKTLDPWMSFTLHSRLLGWDDKWFYIEQRFERHGELYAYGLVRALFRGVGRSLAPAEILATLGTMRPSPPLPDVCLRWRETVDSTRTTASSELRITA